MMVIEPADTNGVSPSVAAALAVAASVVTYVTCVRSLQLGDFDFYVCAAALLFALWLAAGGGPGGPWGPGGPGGRTDTPSTRERFLDSAVSIVNEVLSPTLDRLVLGLSGKNADGSTSASSMMSDDKLKNPPKTSLITPDRFVPGQDGSPLEYKRIGYLLCRLSESHAVRYAALLAKIGMPPKVEDKTA